MFMVPLYFQAVRGDSPSEAGLRLIVPALATPVGGVIAGTLMHRGNPLCLNVRLGTATMLLGNLLAMSMGTSGNRWKEFVFLVPANLGLGLTNPSVLFSFVSLFEHGGKQVFEWDAAGKLTLSRASCGDIDCVPDPIHGHHLRRYCNIGYRPEYVAGEVAGCVGGCGD
jgi:hypothetical protein